MAMTQETVSSPTHTYYVIIFVIISSSLPAQSSPLLCSFSPLAVGHHYYQASAHADSLLNDARSISGGSSSHVDRSICERQAAHGSVNVMSTCPWHYEEEVRGDRWPARILRAVLTCPVEQGAGCLAVYPNSSAVVQTSKRCLPINRHVSVVTCFTDAHGRPSHRREIIPVPVAYTCAW